MAEGKTGAALSPSSCPIHGMKTEAAPDVAPQTTSSEMVLMGRPKPKSTKITFNTFLDAFNPLKLSKHVSRDSEDKLHSAPNASDADSSDDSDGTTEIPRAFSAADQSPHNHHFDETNGPYFCPGHPVPPRYQCPPPPPHYPFLLPQPSPVIYYPFRGGPYDQHESISVSNLDGHGYSNEQNNRRRYTRREKTGQSSPLEVETSTTTRYLYRHYCCLCGRSRSNRYHRKHPVEPGVIPFPGICRRCRPGNDDDDEVANDDDGDGKERKIVKKEVEEVLVKRDRSTNEELQSRPTTARRVTARRRQERSSSSPSPPAERSRKSQKSTRRTKESPLIVRKVYKSLENERESSSSSSSTNSSSSSDSNEEPQRSTRDRSPIVVRVRIRSRSRTRDEDEPSKDTDVIVSDRRRATEERRIRSSRSKSKTHEPEEESGPCHVYLVKKIISKEKSNNGKKFGSSSSRGSPSDDNDSSSSSSSNDREIDEENDLRKPRSIEAPQEVSAPEWYFRRYHRCAQPGYRKRSGLVDTRESSHSHHRDRPRQISQHVTRETQDSSPQRAVVEYASREKEYRTSEVDKRDRDRKINGKGREVLSQRARGLRYVNDRGDGADSERELIKDRRDATSNRNSSRSRYSSVDKVRDEDYRERSRRVNSEDYGYGSDAIYSRTAREEPRRSRVVQFASPPGWNKGREAINRQREAIRDLREEESDQGKFERAKKKVRQRVSKAAGAYELDGHYSEDKNLEGSSEISAATIATEDQMALCYRHVPANSIALLRGGGFEERIETAQPKITHQYGYEDSDHKSDSTESTLLTRPRTVRFENTSTYHDGASAAQKESTQPRIAKYLLPKESPARSSNFSSLTHEMPEAWSISSKSLSSSTASHSTRTSLTACSKTSTANSWNMGQRSALTYRRPASLQPPLIDESLVVHNGTR